MTGMRGSKGFGLMMAAFIVDVSGSNSCGGSVCAWRVNAVVFGLWN